MKILIRILISVVLLLIGGAACHLLLGDLPLRQGEPPRAQHWQPFDIPDQDQYFFAEPLDDELSQSILYHDLSNVIDMARKADVIFIGNSRLNLGLRGDYLVPLAEASGVSVFSLGCGHAEMHSFAMELIRKHDLRPRVLVFVGGPRYYGPRVSPPALEAMAMTRWQAMKKRLEVTSSFYAAYYLHQLIPRLDVFDRPLFSAWLYYRSYQHGFTRILREPPGRYPVAVMEDRPADRGIVAKAARLNEELGQRDTLMVTTLVPFVRTETWHLRAFSEELGIPYILPRFDGLTTADASHLNAGSAEVYTARFWQAFLENQQVAEQLSLINE